MCITYKYAVKEKKEWLKDQPEMITAYKVVEVKDLGTGDGLYPLFRCSEIKFKSVNLLKKITVRTSEKICSIQYDTEKKGYTTYVAYYHLFAGTKDEIKKICEVYGWDAHSVKIIKCAIPKKYIADIGKQWNMISIVTRCFHIVGNDKYL